MVGHVDSAGEPVSELVLGLIAGGRDCKLGFRVVGL